MPYCPHYGCNLAGMETDGRDGVGSVMLCSLAVLDLRVGHTIDVPSPFISVLYHFD